MVSCVDGKIGVKCLFSVWYGFFNEGWVRGWCWFFCVGAFEDGLGLREF